MEPSPAARPEHLFADTEGGNKVSRLLLQDPAPASLLTSTWGLKWAELEVCATSRYPWSDDGKLLTENPDTEPTASLTCSCKPW